MLNLSGADASGSVSAGEPTWTVLVGSKKDCFARHCKDYILICINISYSTVK
jgi:hypothetical protein